MANSILKVGLVSAAIGLSGLSHAWALPVRDAALSAVSTSTGPAVERVSGWGSRVEERRDYRRGWDDGYDEPSDIWPGEEDDAGYTVAPGPFEGPPRYVPDRDYAPRYRHGPYYEPGW